MKLYQTSSMESAMRAMGERNHYTQVYHCYRSIKPIRFRLNLTRDIPVEVCLSWKPFAQQTIDRWQAKGGTMLYRPLSKSKIFKPPPSDAMLFVECPTQSDKFENIIKDVRQEVVIYRPPTWELHNETVQMLYPNKEDNMAFDAITAAFVGRDLTPEQEGVLQITKIPREYAAVFNSWDIEQLTGWKETRLRYVMLGRYTYFSHRYHLYSTRIPPDDPTRWAYDVLVDQPEVAPGIYAMRLDRPPGTALPNFKTAMRRLLSGSYIVGEGPVYVVDMRHPQLDYDRIEAISNMHHGRWFKMKSLVDSLPEYEYD